MMKNPEKRTLVDGYIRQVATRWKIKIIELNVQSDHIHCTTHIPTTMTALMVLHRLKGFPTKKTFKKVPNFIKLRYSKEHFWSRSKLTATVGFISAGLAREYVRN